MVAGILTLSRTSALEIENATPGSLSHEAITKRKTRAIVSTALSTGARW